MPARAGVGTLRARRGSSTAASFLLAHFAEEFSSRLAEAAVAVARYRFSAFSAEFLHILKNFRLPEFLNHCVLAHFAEEFPSRLAVAAAAVARYSFSDFSAEFFTIRKIVSTILLKYTLLKSFRHDLLWLLPQLLSTAFQIFSGFFVQTENFLPSMQFAIHFTASKACFFFFKKCCHTFFGE